MAITQLLLENDVGRATECYILCPIKLKLSCAYHEGLLRGRAEVCLHLFFT